jgi:hypothetical protein
VAVLLGLLTGSPSFALLVIMTVALSPRPSGRCWQRKVALTGDNRTSAQAVALTLKIDDVIAELLPDQGVVPPDTRSVMTLLLHWFGIGVRSR